MKSNLDMSTFMIVCRLWIRYKCFSEIVYQLN